MGEDATDGAEGVAAQYQPIIGAIREFILAGEAFRMSVAHAREIGVRETTAISHLRNQPGMSQQELAGVLRLSPAAITALVDRLEAQNLARRSMSPVDRRVTLLTITPLADQFLDFAWSALRRCVDGTPGVNTPEVVSILATLAGRLREEATRL